MSIIVKGMGMPESCEDCSAQIIDPTGGASGCAVNHSIILRKRGERRPAECPLVEVPKHGRLIDADALMSTIKEHDYHLYDRLTDTTQPGMFTFGIAYAVCTAQTIIEAEE